jgi:predicted O-methyltransferase YrrM
MEDLLERTSNIKFVESFSTDYLKRLVEGDFDLVYLDGDHAHKTIVKELRLVLTRLKRGFILAGHDMYPSTRKQSQVQKAVHEVLPGIHEGDLIIHRFSDSSWAVAI